MTAAGVTYLTAAGNDNLCRRQRTKSPPGKRREYRRHRTVRRSLGSIVRRRLAPTLHELRRRPVPTRPSASRYKPGATLTIDLQWAEPWYGVETDLDAYLVNEAGNTLLFANPINNIDQGPEGEGFWSADRIAPVAEQIERIGGSAAGHRPVHQELQSFCEPDGETAAQVRPARGRPWGLEHRVPDLESLERESRSARRSTATPAPTAAITLGAVRYTESASGAGRPGALLLARPGHALLRARSPAPRPLPRSPAPEVVRKPNLTPPTAPRPPSLPSAVASATAFSTSAAPRRRARTPPPWPP